MPAELYLNLKLKKIILAAYRDGVGGQEWRLRGSVLSRDELMTKVQGDDSFKRWEGPGQQSIEEAGLNRKKGTSTVRQEGRRDVGYRSRHFRKLGLSFGLIWKGSCILVSRGCWKPQIAVGKQRTWPWLPERPWNPGIGHEGFWSGKQSS